MDLLIKGGRVIDPERNFDGQADLAIENGKILKLEERIRGKATEVIDANGLIVVPGLIDMHVHLREPGREDKETIFTGMKAAAKGGFASVCCMPNTNPAIDNEGIVQFVLHKAKQNPCINVFPVAAATRGREGKEMTEIGKLMKSGAAAISDDGSCISDSGLLRHILEYAGPFGIPVLEHCEDIALSCGGLIHEGVISTMLGLKGIPSTSEEVMVARDILLSESTGMRIHIQHVSSAGSVGLLRRAKERNVPVTAETAPHYLLLTDENLQTYDTNFKMNPPLRSVKDRDALIAALSDGTIDAIATDHAPHLAVEKEVEFDRAPFGIIGLETCVPLLLDRMVRQGHLDITRMIDLLSSAPARIMRFQNKGTFREGADGDVTLIDTEKAVVFSNGYFESKCWNSPFLNWKCRGAPVCVIVEGKKVMENGEVLV